MFDCCYWIQGFRSLKFIKNGLHETMRNPKGSEFTYLSRRLEKLSSMEKKLCWIYGEIVRDIIHLYFLKCAERVSTGVSVQLLQCVHRWLVENSHMFVHSRNIVILHGNSKTLAEKIWKELELGWSVIPHPFYSSDFELADYYIFRSLQRKKTW